MTYRRPVLRIIIIYVNVTIHIMWICRKAKILFDILISIIVLYWNIFYKTKQKFWGSKEATTSSSDKFPPPFLEYVTGILVNHFQYAVQLPISMSTNIGSLKKTLMHKRKIWGNCGEIFFSNSAVNYFAAVKNWKRGRIKKWMRMLPVWTNSPHKYFLCIWLQFNAQFIYHRKHVLMTQCSYI